MQLSIKRLYQIPSQVRLQSFSIPGPAPSPAGILAWACANQLQINTSRAPSLAVTDGKEKRLRLLLRDWAEGGKKTS